MIFWIFFSYFVSHSWGIPMMKITGLSHLLKWENLHNWWLTKYFFAPLYLDASLSTVSMGCNTQAICHFWNGLRPFEHNDCASTTASYTLVYIWIFINYYGEIEMAATSMYLERSNMESTHISMVCSSLHRREGRSQQSSLAFRGTWTRTECWKQLILTG